MINQYNSGSVGRMIYFRENLSEGKEQSCNPAVEISVFRVTKKEGYI